MNIFGNALKYTQKGSIVVKLALDPSSNSVMEDAERMLEIRVMDTGKGISSEVNIAELFPDLYQFSGRETQSTSATLSYSQDLFHISRFLALNKQC